MIACTPDGLIPYISDGFEGRTSDKMIVEKSKFVELLDKNARIIADRGFKHIDELLVWQNLFIRPPSVSLKQNVQNKRFNKRRE